MRSGDVIPKVLKVIKNDASCKDIVLPEVCNCCGSKLVRDGVNLCCKNKKCEDQVVNQLVLFIKNLGVKSASNATLKNFGITSFEDLVKFEPNKKYKSELKLAEAGLRSGSVGMHDVSVLRITPEDVWDNLAESLREDALVDVLDGVVHVFFRCTHAPHHISVVHNLRFSIYPFHARTPMRRRPAGATSQDRS